jgi:hypothetical protein
VSFRVLFDAYCGNDQVYDENKPKGIDEPDKDGGIHGSIHLVRRLALSLCQSVIHYKAALQSGTPTLKLRNALRIELPQPPLRISRELLSSRLDRDVLGLSGLISVVWLEGINDLGAGHAVNDIIAGYVNVVQRLHMAGIKVVVGYTLTSTLLNSGGDGGLTVDANRKILNTYICTPANFDSVAASTLPRLIHSSAACSRSSSLTAPSVALATISTQPCCLPGNG